MLLRLFVVLVCNGRGIFLYGDMDMKKKNSVDVIFVMAIISSKRFFRFVTGMYLVCYCVIFMFKFMNVVLSKLLYIFMVMKIGIF